MKSRKLIYILLFGLIFVFGLFVFYQRILAQSAMSAFLKEARLRENDIIYTTKEKPIFQDGLILYDVELPQIKINHMIDKLVIRKEKNDLVLQFQGIHVDLPKTLYENYGNQFAHALKMYEPFKDALKKPLISLALMGIDKLTFDAVVIFNPNETPYKVNSKLSLPNLGEIQLSFMINPQTDSGYRKNLIYFAYGSIPQIGIDIQDTGIFQKYTDYLNSVATQKSKAYAKELSRHSTFTRRIEFETPLSIAPYYRAKSDSEWWK